jgi:hypothetical protein
MEDPEPRRCKSQERARACRFVNRVGAARLFYKRVSDNGTPLK